MKKLAKTFILWFGKFSGLFMLSRFIMRRRLLVLCFHGFEVEDESRFRPKLFMRPDVFRSRLEMLKKRGFTVLPLSEAVERHENGTLPNNSVVITIDDGFASTLTMAAPLLRQFQMPATLYQTTYYVDKPIIFRLAVQYMFWKTTADSLDTTGEPWSSGGKVSIADAGARDKACWAIIDHCEKECGEQQRQEICHRLGDRLGVDYGEIVRSRILSLLTSEEIEALPASGVDVQLHTHRHRLPGDETQTKREIEDNREFLRKLVPGPLVHLCYPSGVWDRSQFPWLQAVGVVSATTCHAGFNTAATDKLALRRFLDEDDLPAIEFEGTICGFLELLCIVSGKRRRTAGMNNPDTVALQRHV